MQRYQTHSVISDTHVCLYTHSSQCTHTQHMMKMLIWYESHVFGCHVFISRFVLTPLCSRLKETQLMDTLISNWNNIFLWRKKYTTWNAKHLDFVVCRTNRIYTQNKNKMCECHQSYEFCRYIQCESMFLFKTLTISTFIQNHMSKRSEANPILLHIIWIFVSVKRSLFVNTCVI